MVRQEELRSRFHALGFDQVRFVRFSSSVGAMEEGLHDWIADGFHGEMEWMARTADKRCDPTLVLKGARSAVLLGVNYWTGDYAKSESTWARYALYEDYHDTVKAALVTAGRLLEEFYQVHQQDYRYYVDTGPVLERGWAERSGMGFVGKNAMLISREFGNWLFLAELLTRLDFAPDPPQRRSDASNPTANLANRVGLYCGKCTRCMDACPTAAIRAPGVLDARRCISYQTIENRGIIPRELRPGIGTRIYGCDVCLEVCPWNRFAQESRRVLLNPRYDLAALPLSEILELTPEKFVEVFRKTPIKRTKLTGLLRNACIVAGNTRASNCLESVLRLASHESPIVRAHAVWAVFRIVDFAEAAQRLATARATEKDPLVLTEYAAEEGVFGAAISPKRQQKAHPS